MEYWTEAIVLTNSDNSFGQTEISYLENRFYKLATEAKRYIVTNRSDPPSGHITEEKESELEEFLDHAKLVIGALGYKVFEPLIPILPVTTNEPADTVVDQIFYIKRKGANAKCKLTNEGIVVLAGSVISKDCVPSCWDRVIEKRELNRQNINENNVLLQDFLFNSPTGASDFVVGSPSNGNVEWKTEDGKTLKDVENGEISMNG
jgi:hypothetical protein